MPPADASTFVALRHRNFRLLWFGQLVSMSGTMMQTAAILWHVSLLAPPGWKALALGMVGLARIGPILVFGLGSGVMADAVDRRRLMLAAQSVMMLTAATLALVTASGLARVWLILLIAGGGAAAGAVDGPARQALLPSLVPREHLPNAIGLNSILFQTASVIGPALAGVALATTGVASVYALNALTFLATIGAVLLMRDVPATQPAGPGAISLRALGEGIRFVFGSPLLRATLILDGLATFFCSATALLPLFAQEVVQVGPRGYGWLYAAPSVGAVLASAVMVRLAGQIARRGVVLLVAVAVYGLATIAFGLSRTFWLMFLALAIVRRRRHGQRRAPQHRSPAGDARPAPRPHDRDQHAVLHGRPPARRVRGRSRGPVAGAEPAVVIGGVASLLTTAWIGWRSAALRAYRPSS